MSTNRSLRTLIVLGTGAALLLWRSRHESELQAAAPPPTIQDSDHDGMSDALEIYWNGASTIAEMDANPVNADTDQDGQPDGFEFCLSGGKSVVSPGFVHPVTPKITLGAHQEGDEIVLSMFVVPADVSVVDAFHFIVGVQGPSNPVLVDLTELLVGNIEAVGSASYSGYSLAVIETRVPMNLIRVLGSASFAAIGTIAGVKTADSATLTVTNGVGYRWVYTELAGPPAAATFVEGEAQPLSPDVPNGAVTSQTCETQEVREPTATPGVLQSLVLAAACQGGKWSCNFGYCSSGGPAAQPKLVLDTKSLLK